MLTLTKSKIIGIVLVAVGILSTINLDFELMTPSNPDNYPMPEASLLAVVEPLSEDFAAGEADITGLFDAIGLEVLSNERLISVSQVKALNIIVVERFLPLVGFKPVSGLGSKLNAIVLEVEANPEAELTPELRQILAEVYFAIEYVARKAS